MDSSVAVRASEEIRHAIETSGGPLPPNFLVHFLLSDWHRYLTLTRHTYGENSEENECAIKTTQHLLRSVTLMPTEEGKAELIALLPSLLAGLHNGMALADMNAESQTSFLLKLRDWHLRLIRDAYEAIGPTFDPTRAPRPDDTLPLEAHEIRSRELMDMLDNAEVQHIDIVSDAIEKPRNKLSRSGTLKSA